VSGQVRRCWERSRLDIAAVLSPLDPASTVILACVLLKERTSATQNAGIVGALVSVALISARWRQSDLRTQWRR
jgi:drug/metabolite transporter (DMT)-like permease